MEAGAIAHGRRQFVEIVQNFPWECRYVLQMMGRVYGYDAEAREQQLRGIARPEFHERHSGPVMEELHRWLEAQLSQKKTEPNSSLGKPARVQLGRSLKLSGAVAKAKAAYESFFGLWKDADPEIPLLITARDEYSRL